MNTEDILFQIDREMQNRGHGKMDANTLKETYQRLQNPNVVNAFTSGQLTVSMIADHADQAIQTVKKQSMSRGMLQPSNPSNALPLGNSRIFGQQDIANSDSLIHNLPATPEDNLRAMPLLPMPLPREQLLYNT